VDVYGSESAVWRSGLKKQEEGSVVEDRLLTVKEAANVLQVSSSAIRRWLYQRKLTKVKIGRCVRLRKSDVDRIISGGLEVSEVPR